MDYEITIEKRKEWNTVKKSVDLEEEKLRSEYNEQIKTYQRKMKYLIYVLLNNKCQCCGETDPSYFNIDHVHNDGSKDKKYNIASWSGRYKIVKRNPSRYQILCANFNYAKHQNGGEMYVPELGWVVRKNKST